MKQNLHSLCTVALSSALLFTGCSDSSDHQVSQNLGFDLSLKDNGKKLPGHQAVLYQKLSTASSVEKSLGFEDVTNAFIQMHVEAYKEQREGMAQCALTRQGDAQCTFQPTTTLELASYIKELSKKSESSDIHEMKVDIEKDSNILYRLDAVSMVDIMRDQRMQCYSGTSLIQTLLRIKQGAKNYRDLNHVVIFTPGHVLAGYLVRENDAWNLYGIESTAKGRAKVNYGKLSDLRDAIRIVDAERWMIVEIYKNQLADAEKTVSSLISYTAKKYDISNEQLQSLEFALAAASKTSSDDKGQVVKASQSLNASPLAMGESSLKGEERFKDFDRIETDELKPFYGPAIKSVGEATSLLETSSVESEENISAEQQEITSNEVTIDELVFGHVMLGLNLEGKLEGSAKISASVESDDSELPILRVTIEDLDLQSLTTELGRGSADMKCPIELGKPQGSLFLGQYQGSNEILLQNNSNSTSVPCRFFGYIKMDTFGRIYDFSLSFDVGSENTITLKSSEGELHNISNEDKRTLFKTREDLEKILNR